MIRPFARVVRGAWSRLRGLAHLPDRVAESGHASAVAAARLEVLMREHRLLARQMTLPAPELWRDGPTAVRTASGAVTRCSSLCRQESFETDWFGRWNSRLGYAPRYHRKLWEFAFICQALEERGMLRPGSRGLGFGVGAEPLGACFASAGCRIVATDQAADASGAAAWSRTGQHAPGKDALRAPSVCPDDVFDANVEFRVCDMTAIPADLRGFDFCWSACALEHLGSLDGGLRFIERSLDCLAPGGVAVHTTEFNLTSNDQTLADGPTVLYRRRDVEGLAERMLALGFEMAPLDFDTGDGPLDRYVDLPPYLDAPHLRLAIEGFASTSLAVIIRRPSRESTYTCGSAKEVVQP